MGPDDVEFNLSPNLKQVKYMLGKNAKNRLLCYKQSNLMISDVYRGLFEKEV